MSPLPVSYVSLDSGAATSSTEVEVSVSTFAATAVATGLLMFKLEGYSRLKTRHGENGSYIESSACKVGGYSWTIRFYLNGHTKEHAGFVSLFLCLCSYATATVHAEYEFALVPHQDTPPAAAGHQGSMASKSSGGVCTFGGKDNYDYEGWGSKRFISVDELERSVFLKDDCLAVRCTVTVVRERTVKEKVVQPGDMARLGMLCKCDGELCKRRHDRPASANTFLERFANFCYSICRGGPVGVTQ